MANPRRRLPTTLIAGSLGALLAIEVTGIALARSNPVVVLEPAVAPAAVAMADDAMVGLGSALGRAIGSASTVTTGPIVDGLRSATALTTFVAPSAQPQKAQVTAVKPRVKPAAHATTTSFHGRNHVWIPSLGISHGLQSYPCSRSRPPDAGVYHWGCSGRNNIYLLSHAWSTFKPLNAAYVRGRLHKGMRVWYADGSGRVRQYSVTWWRITAPTTAASWAWAPQSRPSMTLQTCVGSRSQYRLMVRLVQVG
jgi:hypothetical protein